MVNPASRAPQDRSVRLAKLEIRAKPDNAVSPVAPAVLDPLDLRESLVILEKMV